MHSGDTIEIKVNSMVVEERHEAKPELSRKCVGPNKLLMSGTSVCSHGTGVQHALVPVRNCEREPGGPGSYCCFD